MEILTEFLFLFLLEIYAECIIYLIGKLWLFDEKIVNIYLMANMLKFVAFFVPVLGFALGCFINLTYYDNKSEISKEVLNLSGTMFIVQLVLLTLPTIIGFLTVFSYWI